MHREILASNGEALVESLSSAPSSPDLSATTSAANMSYFFSAPASPMHFLLSSSPANSTYSSISAAAADLDQPDFEFGLAARSMSTAEELFANGQIRPGFVSTDQALHRRARSVSPTRTPWRNQRKERASLKPKPDAKLNEIESVSASTSRSSSSNSSSSNSSNANSKRWGFVKDLLMPRSKSEGRPPAVGAGSRRVQSQRNNYANSYSGTGRRRGREWFVHSGSFSPVQYKERLPAETEMRRRTTFLPYKLGFLFGCLGFGRNIATVSSRRR